MSISAPVEIRWPVAGSVSGFIDVFDWDTLVLDEHGHHSISSILTLCTGILPCSLSIVGSTKGVLQRTSNGSIVCDSGNGCTDVTLQGVTITCSEGSLPLLKMYGSALTIRTGNFSGCSASTNGGFIQSFSGAMVDIEDSRFHDMHSAASGGAIFVVGGQLNLSNTSFYRCTSNLGGGALSVQMFQCSGSVRQINTTVYIDSSTFEQCGSSTNGGAIAAAAGVPGMGGFVIVEIISTRFSSNWAGLSGGAISAMDYVQTVLTKLVLENNSALGAGGGALFVHDSYLKFIGLSSFGNSAVNGGGGVILWSGNFEPQILAYCPPGTWSAQTPFCAPDTFCAPVCMSCSKGMFQAAAGSYAPCVPCSAGKFSADEGASHCRDCPSGTASTAIGAGNSSVCLACAAGTYASEPGATGCIPVNQTRRTKPSELAADQALSRIEFEVLIPTQRQAIFVIDEPHAQNLVELPTTPQLRNPEFRNGQWRRYALLHRYPKRAMPVDMTLNQIKFQSDFCLGNTALYGPCVASHYKSLKLYGTPSANSPAFPGIEFDFFAEKKDAYNQRIVTDSSSFLEATTSPDSMHDDHSVLISGTTVVKLSFGVASFSVVLHPAFSSVDFASESTVLQRKPSLFVKGFDTLSYVLVTMVSSRVDIIVANGSAVCPPGYVLVLDDSFHGSCSKCAPGTYSLNPLSATSCFVCPPTAQCSGGNNVNFSVGVWVESGGFYRLIDCPRGYQLLNSINSMFNHDVQQCIACSSTQYILATNNSKFTCQSCPVGASCDGSDLTGLIKGSVWAANLMLGQYRLVSCPSGYELLAITQDSQECRLCHPGSYCLGGLSQSIKCPAKTFALAGANASDSCFSSVIVTVSFQLSMDASRFTADKYKQFEAALAAAGGMIPGRVVVDRVTSITQNRLITSTLSCLVVSSAACDDAVSAAALRHSLTTDKINSQLIAQGLPPGFLQTVTVESEVQPDQGSSFGSIIGTAVGVLLSVTLLIACFLAYRKLRFLSAQKAFEMSFRSSKAGQKIQESCLPPQLSDNYLAEKVLGKGSFGLVLQAKQKHGDEHVAIKIILPDKGVFLKREMRQLQREAKVLRLFTKTKCEHAVHLAGSDGAHVSPKICWFKMELLEGEGLDAAVREHNTSPVGAPECIKVARSVLAALKVMHSEGIVHRDIKPSNIMRCPSRNGASGELQVWSYKLLDFGTALGVDERVAQAEMMTLDRSMLAGVGTAAYMSPEQYSDVDNVRYPTDLWSLGVTLFELATGHLPFEADNDFAYGIVVAADMDAPPPSLLDALDESLRPSFNNGLAKVVGRAMTKRVAGRYQSADEMHEAIYRCLITTGEACYRSALTHLD